MDFNKKFGERIKELRNKNNYTQKALAELIGISEQGVSKWERGESVPDLTKLEDLERVLNTSLSYLIKGIEVKSKNKFLSLLDEAAYKEDLSLLGSINIYQKKDIHDELLLYYVLKYEKYDLAKKIISEYKNHASNDYLNSMKNSYYNKLGFIKNKLSLLAFLYNDLESCKKYGLLTISLEDENKKDHSIRMLDHIIDLSISEEIMDYFLNKMDLTTRNTVVTYLIKRKYNELAIKIIKYIFDNNVEFVGSPHTYQYKKKMPESKEGKLFYSGFSNQKWIGSMNESYAPCFVITPKYSSKYDFIYEMAILEENIDILDYLSEYENKNVLLKFAILHSKLKLIKKYDNNIPWTKDYAVNIVPNPKYSGQRKLDDIDNLFENKKVKFALEANSKEMIMFVLKKQNRNMNIQEALILGEDEEFKTLVSKHHLLKLVKSLTIDTYEVIRTHLLEFLDTKEIMEFKKYTNIKTEQDLSNLRKKVEDNINDDSIKADGIIESFKRILRIEVQFDLATDLIDRTWIINYLQTTEIGDLGLELFVKRKDLEMIKFIKDYSLKSEIDKAFEMSDSKVVRELLRN